MKKCGMFFGALLFVLIPVLAMAQDPGVPDTARVECLDKVRPNSQVVLHVYAFNDEALGSFVIPMAFPDTVSNMDIFLDSVSFVGTRAASATLKNDRNDALSYTFDSTNVVNKNRLTIWAVWIAGGLAPGSGLLAQVYLRTGPAWDSAQYVPVDSVFISPASGLTFAPVAGNEFTPVFVKGCLGNPVIPSITVTSPNGGENWRVGSMYDITWTSKNFSGNVKIEYSTNAGSTWNTIVASTPNDGVHPWTIPGTPTTQAVVKVSDAATGIPSDMSDANFTISTAPTLTVPGMQQVFCDSLNCDTLRFQVYATDGDVLDILSITKHGVGNFYTVPHPSPDTGFFTWVPVPADTLNSPYADTFIVNDGTGLADTGTVMLKVVKPTSVPGNEGDVNGDGLINAKDMMFLVDFLFKNGPEPKPPPAGDINGDCATTLSDIIYLINYLYKFGPPPKIRCNPGDIDYDGYVNIPDVIYFINYLFKSGPAPRSMKSSDVNADCTVDIVDLIYLINFLFRGGPIPQPGCVGPFYKPAPVALAEVELSESRVTDGVIEIPIRSNFGLPLAGVQILVEFDPAQFEPLDPVLTERSQALSLFSSYKDRYQIIGLLDLQAQNSIQAGTGSIIILRFKPKVANYDLNRLKISEAILVDREANTLNTTIKPNSLSTPNLR